MIYKIGIKGYRILGSDCKGRYQIIEVAPEQVPSCCAYCAGSNLHSKGRYVREVRHLSCFSMDTRFEPVPKNDRRVVQKMHNIKNEKEKKLHERIQRKRSVVNA